MTFSVSECIRFGWETFKKRGWFFVGMFLVYSIAGWLVSPVSAIPGGIVTAISNETVGNIVAFVVSVALNVLIGIGWIAFILKAHDNPESAGIADFWHPQLFWKYLLGTFLYYAVIIVGLVLLIVPGIIFSIMYMFIPYLIVDKGMSPVDAFRESKRITTGHKWDLLVLLFATLAITVLGAICLLVGLLVAGPVCALAVLHAYRSLEHGANEVAPQGVAPVQQVPAA